VSIQESAPAALAPESAAPRADATAVERRQHRWWVTLRVTILSVILILLLFTVFVIGLVGYRTTRAALTDLVDRYVQVTAGSTAREIQSALIDSAEPTLAALRDMANRGLLPMNDPDRLGHFLVERLRYDPNVDWLYYGYQASGRFVAATRRPDGTVILTQSSPEANEGRWVSTIVERSGAEVPIDLGAPPGYDPRDRPWYRQAVEHNEVTWTAPYRFFDGPMGITATAAVRDPASGALEGVFGADLLLDQVGEYVSTLGIGHSGHVFLLSPDGRLIEGMQPRSESEVQEALAATLDDLRGRIAALAPNGATRESFDYGGVRYIASFSRSELTGGLGWVTAIVVPEHELMGAAVEHLRTAAEIGLLVLLIAVVVAYFFSRAVARSLGTIARDMEQIGRFQLSAQPAPHSRIKEIAVVSDAVDRMKASLRSFGRYVPTELVRDLLARGEEARLGGETRLMTIHFSDIEGFTSISEPLPPEAVVHYLAEYLDAMTGVLRAHGGTIDKFMGDGIMAFFNAPNTVPDHAAAACRAALEAQATLGRLRERWQAEGKPQFRARIGLHTGEVVVGNIGTPERFAYTVIGDAVNLASRLEGQNKAYGTYICASEDVRRAAGPEFEWRRLDRVAVVGRREGTEIYELLGERGAVPADVLRARDLYEQALDAYFARRFDEAAAGFRAAAGACPDDRAALKMAERAEDLASYGVAEDWDGVYLARSK